MSRAKQSVLLLAAFVFGTAPLGADTILQTNPRGKQVVVQRNSIVVAEDSSSILYKHFELKERRVEIVRLSRGALTRSSA